MEGREFLPLDEPGWEYWPYVNLAEPIRCSRCGTGLGSANLMLPVRCDHDECVKEARERRRWSADPADVRCRGSLVPVVGQAFNSGHRSPLSFHRRGPFHPQAVNVIQFLVASGPRLLFWREIYKVKHSETFPEPFSGLWCHCFGNLSPTYKWQATTLLLGTLTDRCCLKYPFSHLTLFPFLSHFYFRVYLLSVCVCVHVSRVPILLLLSLQSSHGKVWLGAKGRRVISD